MVNIVLDTNALISALGWKKGNPRRIFEKCLFGEYRLVESRNLIEEFTSVMKRPKFDFISEEEKQEFLIHLLQMCDLVEPKTQIEAIKEDPKDNIVLECAVEGKADFIISGDPHLLKLKEFKGIKIVKPAEFLERSGSAKSLPNA